MDYTRYGSTPRRRLTRKNLMVEPRKVRRLARALRTSESEAVRTAVDAVLLEHEIMRAVGRIRSRGGIEDVFHRFNGTGR